MPTSLPSRAHKGKLATLDKGLAALHPDVRCCFPSGDSSGFFRDARFADDSLTAFAGMTAGARFSR